MSPKRVREMFKLIKYLLLLSAVFIVILVAGFFYFMSHPVKPVLKEVKYRGMDPDSIYISIQADLENSSFLSLKMDEIYSLVKFGDMEIGKVYSLSPVKIEKGKTTSVDMKASLDAKRVAILLESMKEETELVLESRFSASVFSVPVPFSFSFPYTLSPEDKIVQSYNKNLKFLKIISAALKQNKQGYFIEVKLGVKNPFDFKYSVKQFPSEFWIDNRMVAKASKTPSRTISTGGKTDTVSLQCAVMPTFNDKTRLAGMLTQGKVLSLKGFLVIRLSGENLEIPYEVSKKN